MFYRKSAVSVLLSVLVISIALISFLPACSSSGGGAQDTGNTIDPETMPPGTGGITFRVAWQPPSSGSYSKILMAAAVNSCSDYGIDTIAATVSSGTTTVTTASWPCSLHEGKVSGVPAGMNYTVKLEGKLSTTTRWSGSKTPLTVNTGQVTDAGIIIMNYVPGDLTPATATISPNSNPAITTNVPVTDRIKIVFSKSMAPSTVSSTNITLNGTVPGTVGYDVASKTATFIPSSNLAYNTSYTLQVLSGIKDTAGIALSSTSPFTFTTELQPTGLASAPSLTTRAGNSQVRLDWPAVNGATSYKVYYSTSSPVSMITGTEVKAPSLQLKLTNNTTYYYIVTAVNSFGESASAETSATPTFPAGNNPPTPADLTVDYSSPLNYIVSWTPVGGMSYNLYWSTKPIYPDHNEAENVIRYIDRYTTGGQYVHTGVSTGVTYCYILTAINAAGESADSKQVCGPGTGDMFLSW